MTKPLLNLYSSKIFFPKLLFTVYAVKTNIILTCIILIFDLAAVGQNPVTKQWDRRFGGSESDGMYFILQTKDGGFMLGGDSDSPISGDKSETCRGGTDYWIVKIDSQGNKQWDKRFGGSSTEQFFSVIQTTDGGYLVGGWSKSEKSGDKSQWSQGGSDYWIVKTDSNGHGIWDARFGGRDNDELRAMEQTADGGYILAGNAESDSTGDMSQPNWGVGSDYWLVKVNAAGVKEWDYRYGGTDEDLLNVVHQLNDGGYIIGGFSRSPISGDMTQAPKGISDYWIVRIDANGVKQWDKRFGGDDKEYLYSIDRTKDQGFIIGGYSFSGISFDKTQDCRGGADFWIIKTDSLCNKEWDARFGGPGDDKLKCIRKTKEGGFAMVGWSESAAGGDKSQDTYGNSDYWIVKTDENGVKQWDLDFGGTNEDKVHSVVVTADQGYLLGGHTFSDMGGDISQPGQGFNDYWVMKLSTDCYVMNGGFGFMNTGTTYTFFDSSFMATSWFWDFGDGTTSTLQNPVHVYPSDGAYIICQIASNSCIADTTCIQLDIATGNSSPSDNIEVNISPNPFSTFSSITFSLPTVSNVAIDIIDINGWIMKNVDAGEQPAGKHVISINRENLTAGIYFVQMKSDYGNFIRKLVVE